MCVALIHVDNMMRRVIVSDGFLINIKITLNNIIILCVITHNPLLVTYFSAVPLEETGYRPMCQLQGLQLCSIHRDEYVLLQDIHNIFDHRPFT